MANIVSIVGVGIMSPVGDSAEMTALSVQSGISAFHDSRVHNKRFDPMTLALIPEDALPPLHEDLQKAVSLTSRQIRMVRLAEKALAEALSKLPIRTVPALFLAGPEHIPDVPRPIDDSFLKHLYIQCKHSFNLAKSKLFAQGRASGIEAIAKAFELLINETEEFILVGGLDSHLDLHLLGTLDLQNRVLADGVIDGFAPGEGAAFLLLASHQAIRKHSLEPLAEVCQPGLAEELGHRYSEQPYKGEGLAEAVARAVTALNGDKVHTVFASLNGENLHAKEWGVAALRSHASFANGLCTEHPADCYGDPGAAAGPLMIALAAFGMQHGTTRGPCLVYCSSEKEKRGALCLKPAPANKR